MKNWEVAVTEIIRGKRSGLLASLVKCGLWFISLFYGMGVRLRNALYDFGLLSQHRAPLPIISVGNIAAGGTGKTPIVQWIAGLLAPRYTVAILSRGYRSAAEQRETALVLDREHPPRASDCGDEPLLHLHNLQEAIVCVSVDRLLAAERAQAAGAQMAILDDGMQHRRLYRDKEIVLIDACDPFAAGYMLPRGLLREPPSSLARADLVILTRVRDVQQARQLETMIRRYTRVPVIATRFKPTAIQLESGGQLATARGRRVAMLCGIANPAQFRKTLELLHADIILERLLPDHMALNPKELTLFAEEARSAGADLILCTAKDRVKLNPLNLPLELGWIDLTVQPIGDISPLTTLLARINLR